MARDIIFNRIDLSWWEDYGVGGTPTQPQLGDTVIFFEEGERQAINEDLFSYDFVMDEAGIIIYSTTCEVPDAE